MSNWLITIGLEVHVQLNTQAKLFSGASTTFGAPANTQACFIDLGLPGVLPVVNQAAIEKAVRFGLAIDAEIGLISRFDRKHYFYPDLPKGYQTTQLYHPIVGKGHLNIEIAGQTKAIQIDRAHLEEDAGKSIHESLNACTGLDYNRAGVPLLEVVSAPVLSSSAEAVIYLKTLHALVRYLDICDGNMAQGSFRCDCNVSVRPRPEAPLGTRTELKNLNSFRFIEQAIDYEVARQIDCLENGEAVTQETRLYDPERHETRSMRSKEEAHDYRYFPCPDLPPVVLTTADIARIRATLPELPRAKCARFSTQYQLKEDVAKQLTRARDLADFFEAVVAATEASAAEVANWFNGEITAYLNEQHIELSDYPLGAQQIADLLSRLHDGTLSGKLAKQVLQYLLAAPSQSVDALIEQHGLRQVSDSQALASIIDSLIADNPKQVEQYRSGKTKVFGFFVGQVMKQTGGKASPDVVNAMLRARLDGE